MASSKKPATAARAAKSKAKPQRAAASPRRVTRGSGAAARAAATAATATSATATGATATGATATGATATGAAATGAAATRAAIDAVLFDPLTPGEVADALRTLTEDRRLTAMAKVGRYRVICCEPLVVKPPHALAGHRLARVVAYDYATDRTVDACVDLDAGAVAHLELTRAQPMLSRDEELLAVSIATADERVRDKLALGDVPRATLHYWGRTADDLEFARRSAAVVFGRADGSASIVAVVDLLESMVTQVVAAERW